MKPTSRNSNELGLYSKLHQPVWYWSIAFFLAGFYLVTSLYISAHRLLWNDEIFTANTSRLPFHTMWKVLSDGADQIPPLYFLITHFFDQAFDHSDIGIRVPSALGLGAGMLVTFDIARRLTDGFFGLVAMSLLSTSFVLYYGYEARPYGLYFMLAAIALWLWAFTKDESITAAIAFGMLFCMGEALHFYFFLCLTPFGLLALAERRIHHPKVIAAVLGVVGSLAMLHQQITSSHNLVRLAWALPSMAALQSVYLELFPTAILPLVLIAVGVVVFNGFRERVVVPMSSGERVSWLFLSVPLACYLVALLVTNMFVNRYVIGTVPGVVVASTCLLWRHCGHSRHLPLALLAIFAGIGINQQLQTLGNVEHIAMAGDQQEETRQMLALEETLQREGKRHFVLTSNLLFIEASYYSKHPEQYQYAGGVGKELFKYVRLDFPSHAEIIANASQTAVISPTPDLVEVFERAGIHLRLRFAHPFYVFYLEQAR